MGIKAKLVTLDAGYDREKQEISELVSSGVLELNCLYDVLEIDVYSSNSTVLLDKSPYKIFNSVFFDFYDSETGEEIDIYDEEVSKDYQCIYEYY